MLMESRIGEEFEAIVSGASPKGTWIRLFHPHVEGKLVKGYRGLKVGQKLKARLIQINVGAGLSILNWLNDRISLLGFNSNYCRSVYRETL